MSGPSIAALRAGALALQDRAMRLRRRARDPSVAHDVRKVCKRAAERDDLHAQELLEEALGRTQVVPAKIKGTTMPLMRLGRRQAE